VYFCEGLVLKVRHFLQAAKRWEKSPFGTIFPNYRSTTPTVGKPSLLPQDVLPTVAFDAFQFGTSSSLNDDKAERSLAIILKNLQN
jgi:hypothetical protein